MKSLIDQFTVVIVVSDLGKVFVQSDHIVILLIVYHLLNLVLLFVNYLRKLVLLTVNRMHNLIFLIVHRSCNPLLLYLT